MNAHTVTPLLFMHTFARATAKTLVYAFGLSLFLLLANTAKAATSKITATSLFMQIPPSIFDNTYQPLTEEEKEILITNGYTHNWVLIYTNDDTMRFATTTLDDNKVTARVFHAGKEGYIVLGADTPDACAAEIWSFTANGGLIPHPGPQDPAPEDFFAEPYALGKEVTPTFRLCLVGDVLEAKPFFWDDSGLIAITPTQKVLYTWTGSEFKKSITSIAKASPPQQPEVPQAILSDSPKPHSGQNNATGTIEPKAE